MTNRQTRIFVRHNEPLNDWAETLLGQVVRPVLEEYASCVRWFWFSRYVSPINDSADCDIKLIPTEFKQPIEGTTQPCHRSIRFRYDVTEADQERFEDGLRNLINHFGYAISDVREYDQVADTGSSRFLGVENRQSGRDAIRAQLVTQLYEDISRLVLDGLVGPDARGRYRIETNDHTENPNGSTFESIHHMFFNITMVPLSVLFSDEQSPQLFGTYWGKVQRTQKRVLDEAPFVEAFVPY